MTLVFFRSLSRPLITLDDLVLLLEVLEGSLWAKNHASQLLCFTRRTVSHPMKLEGVQIKRLCKQEEVEKENTRDVVRTRSV